MQLMKEKKELKIHEKMMNKLKKIEGHLKVKARDEFIHQKQMEEEDKKLEIEEAAMENQLA